MISKFKEVKIIGVITMKQIGTPIESLPGGISLTLGFAAFTSGLMYKAYKEGDFWAAFSSIAGVGITALAAYNTYALGFYGDDSYEVEPIGDSGYFL